jgi:hypothetical protein
MRNILLATVFAASIPLAASAAEITIAGFGQPQGATNGFTLSPNATDTATTLSMTNVSVDFTNFFGGIPGIGDMTLLANSISSAGSLFGQDGQRSAARSASPLRIIAAA